jgi:hypothetical protein
MGIAKLKYTMKSIHIITILFLLSNCVSKKEEQKIEPLFCCYNFDDEVKFNILNDNNQDLLDSTISGYFPYKDMKLYNVINGVSHLAYNKNSSVPNYIHIIKELKPQLIVMSISDSQDPVFSTDKTSQIGFDTSYFELNHTDVDTIISQWDSGPDHFYLTKVWYNGVYTDLLLKYGKVFQVIK